MVYLSSEPIKKIKFHSQRRRVINMNQLISVIIPTYNASEYILKAIDSVMNQTYSDIDIEIVIIDDGSTDDTQKQLEKLVAKKKIKYIYKENGGAASARNLGIQKSRGEFIGFLDADDEYLDGMISECITALNDRSLDLVSVDNYLFSYDNQHALSSEIQRYDWIEKDPQELYCTFLKVGAIGGIHKAFFRRRVFETVGLLDTSLPVYEDLDFWIRIAACGLQWGHIRKPLVLYHDRGRGTSLFTASRKRNMECRLRILRRYKAEAIKRCPGIKKDLGEQFWNFGRSYIMKYGSYSKGLTCLAESLLTDRKLRRVWGSIFRQFVYCNRI